MSSEFDQTPRSITHVTVPLTPHEIKLFANVHALYEYVASSASGGCATAQALIDQIEGRS